MPSPANGSWGALRHEATGLCLDANAAPSGHGCLAPAVRGLPFCNASLPLAARVADAVSRLTLEEAIRFTGAGPYNAPCVAAGVWKRGCSWRPSPPLSCVQLRDHLCARAAP